MPILIFGNTANWFKKFQGRFGYEPKLHNALAGSAAVILGEAIKAAGTTDAEAASDALTKIKIETFFAPMEFDKRGVNVSAPVLVNQMQDLRDFILWPEAIADAKPVYPLPKWQ